MLADSLGVDSSGSILAFKQICGCHSQGIRACAMEVVREVQQWSVLKEVY
jgi:hypothetical protein